MFIEKYYNLVMSENFNAFRNLPRVVAFRYMLILSYMWSIILTLWTGHIALFGFSMVGHILLLLGVFFTGDIFRRARDQALVARSRIYDDRC